MKIPEITHWFEKSEIQQDAAMHTASRDMKIPEITHRFKELEIQQDAAMHTASRITSHGKASRRIAMVSLSGSAYSSSGDSDIDRT